MRPFPPYYSAKYGDGDEVRRCTLVFVDIHAPNCTFSVMQ